MKEKVICGMQQVGVGVADVIESWKWYYDIFGFDIKIFDDDGVAERMLPYTGGKPQPRRAILTYNLQGGGGLEIWQPKGRNLNYPREDITLGDFGIFACKIKCRNIDEIYEILKKKNVTVLSSPSFSPSNIKHFFVKDPYNNVFQLEEDNYIFRNENKLTGGVNGVIIGVSNIEKSIEFYSKILQYDKVVYNIKGQKFDDLKVVKGGDNKISRVLLERSKPLEGPLSKVIGTSHIELIKNEERQVKKIYDGRYWGDPGFIHVCFDVRNMEIIEKEIIDAGHSFVCNSGNNFGMWYTNAWFTYVEDPDGTLIEFVETHKIAVNKKLGIYLYLRNKNDKKPLPNFITKAIRFLKVKEVK